MNLPTRVTMIVFREVLLAFTVEMFQTRGFIMFTVPTVLLTRITGNRVVPRSMTVYLGSFVLLPAKPELTHIAADKLSGAKRVDNR